MAWRGRTVQSSVTIIPPPPAYTQIHPHPHPQIHTPTNPHRHIETPTDGLRQRQQDLVLVVRGVHDEGDQLLPRPLGPQGAADARQLAGGVDTEADVVVPVGGCCVCVCVCVCVLKWGW